MQYNMPTYDTTKLTFGPARLFLGPADGTTPTVDVGAVSEATSINITREIVDVRQGNPARIIESYCVSETVEISFSGLEIDILKLPYALGTGVTTSAGQVDSLGFGGDMNINECALHLQHIHPAGSTEDLYCWRVRGNGSLARDFASTPTHEVPMTFTCLDEETDWASDSLNDIARYLKWQLTRAA
ncbi:MAG: hypothetical protein GY847_01425 [Proteobacteria bacterium]|nr:hypothetical protein [Pseudomonadota bacterium]